MNFTWRAYICALIFGTTSLQADHRVIAYEQAGDYTRALTIARVRYEESVDLGLPQDAVSLCQDIQRLENQLLSKGSSRLLFDENYQPRVKLIQLLDLVGMGPVFKKNISEISNWAQKNLLRQGERWQEQMDKFEGLICTF